MKVLSLLMFAFLSLPAHAGDKVGNGGGLWACEEPAFQLKFATLVDFYEAQNEMGLSLLTPTRSNPMEVVDEVGALLRERFPDYYPRWENILRTAVSRIYFTNAALEHIDDHLHHVIPLPAQCPSGWKYLQFANYNDTLERVLIRKDVWESPVVSALDKAGLIWHEAIYRWMREEFGDTNSDRARQVIGVLFSTLPTNTARAKLQGILAQGSLVPSPQQPVWTCYLINGISNRYYLDYGISEMTTKARAIKLCRTSEGEDKNHCRETSMKCDSFTSMQQKFTCSATNGLSGDTFTETGRSPREAEGKARRACSEAPNPFHCRERLECE